MKSKQMKSPKFGSARHNDNDSLNKYINDP